MPRGPSQGNNHNGGLTLEPLSRINAYNCNPLNHVNYTGPRNRFFTRYTCIIITIYGYNVIHYAVLIVIAHTWINPGRFFLYFSFHGPYYVQTFKNYHTNRLTLRLNYTNRLISELSHKFLHYNSRTKKFWITLSILLINFNVYLIYKPKCVNPCGNFYRLYTGFILIILF